VYYYYKSISSTAVFPTRHQESFPTSIFIKTRQSSTMYAYMYVGINLDPSHHHYNTVTIDLLLLICICCDWRGWI